MDHLFLFSLFLFLLSLLLVLGSNRSESKYSLPISSFAFILANIIAAAVLLHRLFERKIWTLSNFFEGFLFAIVLLGVVAVAFERVMKIRSFQRVICAMNLILGLIAFYYLDKMHITKGDDFNATLGSHVYFMFLTLAAFSLSFIFSIFFLFQEMLLKRKLAQQVSLELPSLEFSNRMNIMALGVGSSAYFIGMIAGWVHALLEGNLAKIAIQPYSVLATLMMVLYIVLVSIRIGPFERARTVSISSVIFFLLFVFVVLGSHS